jgi:putative IMPACT (imprinted ancient) family translation regulator
LSAGARFFVENELQVSGVSMQDFTNTVSYKLLSENEAVLVTYDVNISTDNLSVASPEMVLKSNLNAVLKQAPVLINLETNVMIFDFEMEDILLTNAVVSSIKKETNLLYVLEIVPIQQGVFSIEIPENVVLNSENKGNSSSNKLTFIYDLISPYLLSIKRKNEVNEIIDNDILEFTVTFSEPVENVSSADFVSVADATCTLVKENDASYVITIDTITDYYGAVSLNVKSGTSIQDKAGNLLLNTFINVHQN